MKKYLRRLITILFLIGLAGGVFLFQRKPPEKYKTAKVKKIDLLKTVAASGEVISEKKVTLKFQTSGKLAWVGVKQGDRVQRGQAIASLDKTELKKKFQKYANDYLEERWDFEQTQEDYQETKERHLVTDEIQRILDKAQFDLNKAVLDYEIADLAVKYATIYSPLNGIVTQVDMPMGGMNITPAKATFTVADPQEVVFEANIDEIDIAGVKEGQKALLTLDAYPEEEMKATVIQVGFQAVSTRGGGTAFPVKISLPENKDLKFKLGMNGEAEIILAAREDALVVDSSAVMKRGEKHYVFVVEDGVARKQEVKIGLRTETKTEIVEGVNQGDEVIIEKVSKIKEGQRIK